MSYLKNLKRLKYISLLICVFFFGQQYTSAQTAQSMLFVNGYRITVKGNDSLYVNGTVAIDTNSLQTDNIHIEGRFILTDTLINNVDSLFLTSTNPGLSNDPIDTLNTDPMGEVIFRDNRDKYIKSKSSIFFTDLTVDQGVVVLDTSVKVIKVLGEIDLDQGNLDLNGSNIELYDLFETINLTSGKIKSGTETNYFKIYDDDSTGYIKAAKYYVAGAGYDSPNDPANFGFSIDTPNDIGKIFITRFHESDTTVTDGGIKKSYLINLADTAGNLGASKNLQFSYFKSDLFGDLIGNDSSLRIFFKAFNSERYKYLGSDSIGPNDIYVNGVNFNEGYYTIADSICKNPPKINLGANRIICENGEIELIADSVYSIDEKELMTYEWWSPEFVIDNPNDFKKTTLIVPSDTINNFLEDTLSIYLMVADERGCINLDTIQFYIFQNPELDIQTNIPSSEYICIGDTINLYDTKNSDGKYRWTFDQEPYLDTLESPSYVYRNQDGLHEVKLEYTDSNGCVIESDMKLTIHPLPVTNFIVSNNNCLGNELILENTSFLYTGNISGAISKYSWDMGNGNQITITADEIVSDSNLVYDTDTIVGDNLAPDLSYWYNKTGLYNIGLTAETYSGCINDTVISIQVYDSVYAAFDTLLTNVCLGLESRFIPSNTTSDTNLVAEYQWHFNDTVIISEFLDDTVYYQFEESGIYSVSFIAVSKFGCTDTLTQNINIYAAPIAMFIVDPVCLNDQSLLNSTGSSSSDIAYKWYFQDTTIQSLALAPVYYNFSTAGKQKVELEIAFNNGCKSTFTDSAIVLANPDASFTFTDACVNNQVNPLIVNTSSNLNSTYNWDFGDLTVSGSEQPIKEYKNAGKYNVTLNATSDYNINNLPITCNTVYTDSINIFDIASANFKVDEYTNVCEGNTSAFILSELVNTQFVDYFEWHFDSDTVKTYNTDQVDYDFNNDGTYNVTLKTVTEDGCIYEAINTIEILNTPDAAIISDSVCEGEDLILSVPENIRDNQNIYTWEIKGVGVLNGLYTSMASPDSGIYEIALNVTSLDGCINRDTSYAVVNALPSVEFGNVINVCSDTLQLVGTNSDYNYLWNNILASDSYTVRDDQICTVKITDTKTGCKSPEIEIEVSLNTPLNVEIGNDTSVCGNIVLDAGYFGSTAIYNWSNGETSRYINVNISNKYKVTVDQGVCSVSDSIEVIVNEAPLLDLGTDIETCAFDTIILNAEITNGSYLWSNGLTTSSIKLSSDIPLISNYQVTVSDVNNCTASDQIKLTFNPVPNLDLGNDITTCQNIDVVLNASVVNAAGYLWSTSETSSVITPYENGSNIITREYSVIATNQYTCVSKDTISVQFNPVPELILQDEVIACGNEEITLSAYIPDAISYAWNNGSIDSVLTINHQTDGEGIYYVKIENQYNCISTSNQANVEFKTIPNPILPDQITGCNEISFDAGNFGAEFLWNDNITTRIRSIYQSGLYTVEITNVSNCSIIDSIETTVNYVTKPYMGPDISLCTNDQKVLRTGIHDSEYTFEWNGYSTGDTMLIATPGTYIVRAMHSNECEDSDTIEVIGRSLPSLDLGPDMYKCTNDNIILDAGDDGLAYFWEGTNVTGEGNRLFEVPDTGKYWVQVTNEYSCSQSDTILIKHTSLSIEPLFITNSKLVAADSVLFVDMSQPEPVSWLWEFGDLQQSILQNPVHVYYGGGSYQVILHASNSVCNASIVKIIEVENRDKLGDEEEGGEGLFGDKFIEIQNVKVYPNPNNGNFTIEAELSTRSNANLYIFDLMGRLITVSKFSDVEILNQDIDIQGKGAGIYIIKIIAGTDHKTYKIIKQ